MNDRKRELIRTARRMADLGLVAGTVGNVSSRVGRSMLITPTRTPYSRLDAEQIVEIDLDALQTVPRHASREWRLHAGIYGARPDLDAIVHTHSVHATAWSFTGRRLTPELEEHAYYDIGSVATCAPAPSASEQLAASAVLTLADSRAVLLGNHGVVACGLTPSDALVIAEIIERQAQIAWLLSGATDRQ